MQCQYCKDSGKILLLFSYVDCEECDIKNVPENIPKPIQFNHGLAKKIHKIHFGDSLHPWTPCSPSVIGNAGIPGCSINKTSSVPYTYKVGQDAIRSQLDIANVPVICALECKIHQGVFSCERIIEIETSNKESRWFFVNKDTTQGEINTTGNVLIKVIKNNNKLIGVIDTAYQSEAIEILPHHKLTGAFK